MKSTDQATGLVQSGSALVTNFGHNPHNGVIPAMCPLQVNGMPVTPFHFGPGAALHALAPRHVSFMAFCAANILIDVESGYNLLMGAAHVHTFLHTYVGATLVTLAVVGLHAALSRLGRRRRVPNLFEWQALGRRQVALGAALGAYSHILLDSVMHADMQPLLPLIASNGMLHVMSWDALHGLCLAMGLAGVMGLALRWLIRRIGIARKRA